MFVQRLDIHKPKLKLHKNSLPLHDEQSANEKKLFFTEKNTFVFCFFVDFSINMLMFFEIVRVQAHKFKT